MTRRIFLFILSALLCVPGLSQGQLQGQARVDSLLAELPRAMQDTMRAAILARIGSSESVIDPDKGLDFGRQAMQIAESIGWQRGIGIANNSLGLNYSSKSDYSKALEYYNKDLAIMEALGDKGEIGGCLINIGSVYFYQGYYSRALEYFFRALKIKEEVGDKKEVGFSYTNIGNVYSSEGEPEKAFEYWQKGLKIFEEVNSRQDVAVTLSNIAGYYADKKDYAKSLECEYRGLAIYKELGSNSGVAEILGDIGGYYMDSRQYDSALYYSMKSNEIMEANGMHEATARNLSNIGKVYFTVAGDSSPRGEIRQVYMPVTKMAMLKQALIFTDSATELLKRTGDIGSLFGVYKDMAYEKRMMGDYKGALESFEQGLVMHDSMFNLASVSKLHNLETQRELDLKDRQIIIDRLEVDKKRNERKLYVVSSVSVILVVIFASFYVLYRNRLRRLNELYKLRTNIARDLHDEVGSALTSINILSRVSSASGSADVKTADMMKTIAEQSKEVQQNMSDIVWSINPEHDKVEDIAVRMREYLAKTLEPDNKDIALSVDQDISGTVLPMNVRRDLLLVFKEAVNNIARHSRSARVEIALARSGNAITLKIADNGRGLDVSKVTSSSGLKNMQARVADMKGTISITSSAGEGTVVDVRIPLA